MIKIRTQNLNKDSKSFYVVTRGGRRVEENNYSQRDVADLRASKLLNMVTKYSPHEKNQICVVHTSEPHKIR